MSSTSILSGQKRLFGGILLVAGTTIGAGMLALPVETGAGGFLPALFSYFLCWAFMTSTGLLTLEVSLRLPPDANLVSMAGTYLGKGGRIAAWVLYLFLFYTLGVAYLSGGGGLLRGWIGTFLPNSGTTLLFLALLAPIVALGAKAVDQMNRWLMAGLIIAYLAFVFCCIPSVHIEFLQRANWAVSLGALPIIFASFGFQGIIPSLTSYLKRDARAVRIAIVGGTGAAFVIYLLWEFLILGVIPEGALEQAKQHGLTAVAPLKDHVAYGAISLVGEVFAFLAIATSFLGVTLGLFDFLADGLQMDKRTKRLPLMALTFGPPLAISLIHPSLFLTALGLAGGIGCALLLGLLPIMMAYVSRRRMNNLEEVQLKGGNLFLGLLLTFAVFELVVEFFSLSL